MKSRSKGGNMCAKGIRATIIFIALLAVLVGIPVRSMACTFNGLDVECPITDSGSPVPTGAQASGMVGDPSTTFVTFDSMGNPFGFFFIDNYIPDFLTSMMDMMMPDPEDMGMMPDPEDMGMMPDPEDMGMMPDPEDMGMMPDPEDMGMMPDPDMGMADPETTITDASTQVVATDAVATNLPDAQGGTMAGIYAQTDVARGVWKAPAGVDQALGNFAKNFTGGPLFAGLSPTRTAEEVLTGRVVYLDRRTGAGFDQEQDPLFASLPPKTSQGSDLVREQGGGGQIPSSGVTQTGAGGGDFVADEPGSPSAASGAEPPEITQAEKRLADLDRQFEETRAERATAENELRQAQDRFAKAENAQRTIEERPGTAGNQPARPGVEKELNDAERALLVAERKVRSLQGQIDRLGDAADRAQKDLNALRAGIETTPGLTDQAQGAQKTPSGASPTTRVRTLHDDRMVEAERASARALSKVSRMAWELLEMRSEGQSQEAVDRAKARLALARRDYFAAFDRHQELIEEGKEALKAAGGTILGGIILELFGAEGQAGQSAASSGSGEEPQQQGNRKISPPPRPDPQKPIFDPFLVPEGSPDLPSVEGSGDEIPTAGTGLELLGVAGGPSGPGSKDSGPAIDTQPGSTPTPGTGQNTVMFPDGFESGDIFSSLDPDAGTTQPGREAFATLPGPTPTPQAGLGGTGQGVELTGGEDTRSAIKTQPGSTEEKDMEIELVPPDSRGVGPPNTQGSQAQTPVQAGDQPEEQKKPQTDGTTEKPARAATDVGDGGPLQTELLELGLRGPGTLPLRSPEIIGTLDSPDWKQFEAERFREAGVELREEGEGYRRLAEAILERANGWRELGQGARDHAKTLPEGPLREDRLKDADKFDKEADRLEEIAGEETGKAEQAERDADQKFKDARKAKAEAQRRAQERLEAERQASEDKARQLQLEREARIRAKDARIREKQEAGDAARRAGEEVDRQKRELERKFQEEQKRAAERQRAERQRRFQQSGALAEQTGGQVSVQGEVKGPVGPVAKSLAIKGLSLTLEKRFNLPGAGGITGGLGTLGGIKQFGEAAQEVVDGMAQDNKRVGSFFDQLADPRSKIDPRTVRRAQRDAFFEAAGKLVGAAPISTP